jgi:hypothetical protein
MQAKIKSIQNNILTLESLENLKLKVGDRVEVKKINKNRSLDQNNFLWKIIQLIADETGHDSWNLYILGLEHCKVLVEWIETVPEAENTLKRVYRIVQKVENRIGKNGKPTALFRCIIGSSKYNVNEMKLLIDYFLSLASELNINVEME